VRVLLVGNSEESSGLEERLDGDGIAVELRPDDSEPAGGPEEVAAIARELREFEAALGAGLVDAVLVRSASSASLAAVIVATKLGIPVALTASDERDRGVNARLIDQLSGARLAPEAAEVSNWLRDTYTEQA
jgi:UDP-N-acetylglucosamine 2-epimerase